MPMQSCAVAIDVVICTYNRAVALDEVLTVLSGQEAAEVSWRVLVVDNASTDDTAACVARHEAMGLLPELRRVYEAEQGLTAARRRGVRETDAPWIAFVDDDNLLEPGWIAAVARAIAAHPDAGGVGGRVILDWAAPPPPFLSDFGFCFAEQEAGGEEIVVNNLAGAGMVLRRAALVESGWLDRPLLADRVGSSLVSGGDVELAQRVKAAGYRLWYTPHAAMKHRIPASRTSRSYLFRINMGLGASEAVVSALNWPGDWESWRLSAWQRKRRWLLKGLRGLLHAVRVRAGFTAAIAWACFAIGVARGVRRCEALPAEERDALLGAAAPKVRPAASPLEAPQPAA